MAKAKKEEKSGLDGALERLNKQYGVGSVLTLEEKPHSNYDIISTGSVGFDYHTLGIGGVAKSKLYELMGWEGCGKSTICGHIVAECQLNGGKVGYVDGEHAVDTKYFKALGVDTSKMLIAQPSCGEEGFNIAMELINSGEIDLLIIDSDSSLIPKSVLDGEVGDSAIGKKARLNSSAYPKLKGAISRNNVCCIVISQYREKIGVMFGNPTTTQGGHALKFYADVRIEVSRTLAKDGDVNYGNITKVKATKNKLHPPYKQSQFDIVYGKGIDKLGELMELLDEYELGRKYGKTMTVDGLKYDLEEFKKLVIEDRNFYNELRQKVIDKILQQTQTLDANNEEEVDTTSKEQTEL